MKNQLLVAEFLATPWALMPERLSALATVISRWTQGAPASDAAMFQVHTDRLLRDTRRQTSAAISAGGIAVIPIYGVITQRGNMVDDVSGPGMVSTQIVTQMLRQAVADEAVSQILLDIDSPGGSVYGVSELGDAILSARAQKPVVAIANSLAASAAYWIGSQAGEFYVTAGGEVGSIGVWQAHQDYSKAMDEAGVKTTLISAGKFKIEGNPYAPLQAALEKRNAIVAQSNQNYVELWDMPLLADAVTKRFDEIRKGSEASNAATQAAAPRKQLNYSTATGAVSANAMAGIDSEIKRLQGQVDVESAILKDRQRIIDLYESQGYAPKPMHGLLISFPRERLRAWSMDSNRYIWTTRPYRTPTVQPIFLA